MAAILTNLRNTVIAGFVLAFIAFLIYVSMAEFNNYVFWPFLARWLHIMSGVMWIGLLWYFNFVQTPTMPKIPDELKGGVSRFIAPEALFWFRWGAMSTIFFGLLLAILINYPQSLSYLLRAYTLDAIEGFVDLKVILMGLGMWLGTIMWFNVWFIIWPNQQKALNIGNAYPDLPADQKAKAARTAGLTSRVNTMLSVPMLFCMAAGPHLA
jgi:uncharacterized membrane protein|nr:hypothetical protein Hi04_10k_c4983_00018 [uncultured bacterium]